MIENFKNSGKSIFYHGLLTGIFVSVTAKITLTEDGTLLFSPPIGCEMIFSLKSFDDIFKSINQSVTDLNFVIIMCGGLSMAVLIIKVSRHETYRKYLQRVSHALKHIVYGT